MKYIFRNKISKRLTQQSNTNDASKSETLDIWHLWPQSSSVFDKYSCVAKIISSSTDDRHCLFTRRKVLHTLSIPYLTLLIAIMLFSILMQSNACSMSANGGCTCCHISTALNYGIGASSSFRSVCRSIDSLVRNRHAILIAFFACILFNWFS